ncbi:hypothetical protein DL96DRAFT_1628747 [Flagelloscypha sp. PMI_526]|nr:hypothetical protein DL96DRAFT_1628747 [Flagelloscypha sp. PMI_526]
MYISLQVQDPDILNLPHKVEMPGQNWTKEQWDEHLRRHGVVPNENIRGSRQQQVGYTLSDHPGILPDVGGQQFSSGSYDNSSTGFLNPSGPIYYTDPRYSQGGSSQFLGDFQDESGYGRIGPQPGAIQTMERRCTNCGTNETPEWRTDPQTGNPLCNACGIYLRTRGHHRPMNLVAGPPPLPTAPEGYTGAHCSHCRVMDTPTWRRHPQTNQLLCNACGRRYHDTGRLPDLSKPHGTRTPRAHRGDQQ